MIPRIIQPIETEYGKKFPHSTASLFFSHKRTKEWLELLKKAVERGRPLTKDEIEKFYGKKGFELYLEIISEEYGMPKEEILKGLG
jgi:hypothetical protein